MRARFKRFPRGRGVFLQWRWKNDIHQICFMKMTTPIEQ